MTLEELRAQLRGKHVSLKALREKAMSSDGTADDLTVLENEIKDIEDLERKIELAEKSEAIEAKSSLPARNPITHSAAVPAEVKTVTSEQVLSLTAAAIVKGKATGVHPLKVLEHEGYGQISSELGKKAVNTLVSTEGGILVPQAQVGGIIPLLRQQATFLAAGPRRVPFTNGQYKVARGASGATAAYVAESALKPVSTPTFDAIDMRARKLAGIVPMTQEARMWTIGDIEAYVREDLRNALALTLDLNAWLGTGAGASPVGILNKAGVQVLDPATAFADPQNPTIDELDAFASAMQLRLITASLTASGSWRWVMSYRTALRLQDIRVGASADGDIAFPGMQGVGAGNALNWKGFPVTVTSQFPTNGGAETDETIIALVDFAHVLFGEELDIVMRSSDQATLDPDGSGQNLVHLWQQNMFAILAESMHDFGLRFSKAVVKADGIRF